MELTRHDNCAQVVNQCYSIASGICLSCVILMWIQGRMLDLFKYSKGDPPEQEADMELSRCANDIEHLIEEFGMV
jgi:hypothetical protein